MLYPVNADRPSLVWLPVLPDHVFENVRTRWAVDLDLSRWYPSGSARTVVTRVPNLNRRHPPRNHYSLIVARDMADSSPNECIRSLAGLQQVGNVLVVRHAARRQTEVTHMPANERSLVDMVVIR